MEELRPINDELRVQQYQHDYIAIGDDGGGLVFLMKQQENAEEVICVDLLDYDVNNPFSRQRIIIAALIVILMTFLAGWVAVFVSEKFHGTVHYDYTLLTAVDIESCPRKIEYKYTPVSFPDGFEMIETSSSPIDIYTLYENKQTGQGITFSQWVKTAYIPHLNTEYCQIEEVTINDKMGLYIDFGNETFDRTYVVWDNGDYILEISADLDKSDVLNLSNITKL